MGIFFMRAQVCRLGDMQAGLELVIAESLHGVNAGGAAGGQIAGEQSHTYENDNGADVGERVPW
jgi:hypothetical protein